MGKPGFFGRQDTLRALADHLDAVALSGDGRMVAVRGRRQVGKSTAVEKFLERSTAPYVFVTGVFQAPLLRQLRDAKAALTESTRPVPEADLLVQSEVISWRDWLGRIAIAAREGPIVVVLDEFPWLVASDPTLEGDLQAVWDRTLSKLPILLIMIGSDVQMMDQLTTHGRPLFGRITPFVVPALNPAEIATALPRWSPAAIFDAYLVTGGYPRLVSDIVNTNSADLSKYVARALSDPYSPLVTTARLSLDAEFPDPQYAYQVLSAIGANDRANPGFMQILNTITDASMRKSAETATTRALRTLTDVKGLIEREVPAWAGESSKLRRYRIRDPYLRFWFRYIERNIDRISRGRADLAIATFERDWPSWRGHSIEPVIREAVFRLAPSRAALAEVDAVRPWWTRDNRVEIDVVATTDSETALLATIKWSAQRGVTAADLTQLRRDGQRVPKIDRALFAAISPQGKAPRDADLSLSASDLLTAWQ